MNKFLTDIELAPKGGFKGLGPLGLEGSDPSSAGGTFTKFISSAIGVMTIVAIIWFIFKFISGAIGIITAGSDKQALESARKNITMGIIGLVVVIAAIFIIDLFGSLFGIENFLNISDLIEMVSIK